MFKKALAMRIFTRYGRANSVETPVPLKCNVAETKDKNNFYSSNNSKTSDLWEDKKGLKGPASG